MEKMVIPRNSNVEIIEEAGAAEREIVIEVEPGARLTYIIPQGHREPRIVRRRADICADAHVIWYDLNTGSHPSTSRITSRLKEPGARAETYGMFYGHGKARFSITHETEHLAPHTHSRMETRGVLDDESYAAHTSLIKIHPGMSGCAGHERTDTLLLSRHTHVDAVPELEIGNNEVQCTHAVTTTRLSPEKMFYLTGRGLSSEIARNVLIDAHLAPILESIPTGKISYAPGTTL